MSHIDDYRAELEAYYNCSMSNSEHMRLLIPVLKNQYDNEMRSELKNKRVAIVFDGASVDGDLVAILVRYVDNWELKQKLMKVKHTSCSVNNKQYSAH